MTILHDLKLAIFRPQDVVPILRQWLASIDPIDQDKEHFIVLSLDVRQKVKQVEVISIGTLTATLVHAREVYRRAITLGAARIIVAHNHPSKDCSPSDEDLVSTRKLWQAGDVLGIPLVDHIIFSDSSYYSYADEGII
jgi:DNA repair protein RadC